MSSLFRRLPASHYRPRYWQQCVTTSDRFTYLDSSALVKLVIDELETDELRRYLARRSLLISSELALVEVVRSVRRRGELAVHRARTLLDGIDLLRMTRLVLEQAALLDGPLRTLDAIHVQAALSLGDDLDDLITYDDRMAVAAQALGVSVVMPGR
jgi:uncharacterized protein